MTDIKLYFGEALKKLNEEVHIVICCWAETTP